MNITQEIKNLLLKNGASVVGFADLTTIEYKTRKDLTYGIVFGVKISKKNILRIFPGPSLDYFDEYNRLNHQLDKMSDMIERFLKKNKFDAFSKRRENIHMNKIIIRSDLPHKTIATRSGLGWIGKSALLITDKFGPAIRLSSVLTNVKLDIGIPVNQSRCGECNKCREICPANAISGKDWNPNLDRDDFFSAMNCRDKIIERGKKFHKKNGMCGLCIYACPYTQKYLKS